MRLNMLLASVIGFGLPLLAAMPAGAQATRTFVSGVGSDSNPCSRSAPCLTWAGAISKTAAGGEIDALDPGGFGTVTITKSITLDGGGGQVASILASGGVSGIIVNAGASDVVLIRNIRINGAGGGLHGIQFLAAAMLIVDHCEVFGFSNNGVDIALSGNGAAFIRDTTFANNGGIGVNVANTGGAYTFAQIVRSSFVGNIFPTLSGGGVNAAAGTVVNVSNSNFSYLTFGANAAGSGSILSVDSSVFAYIATAVGSNSGTVVNVSANTIVDSTVGFNVAGTFRSAGNNVNGASTPGTPNGSLLKN